MRYEIKLKRVYEEAEKSDGFRILVDRLWPRGLSKEKAKVDLWLKEIAPSDELRKWYHKNKSKWTEFQKRYKEELEVKKEIVNKLKKIIKKEKVVTFLYSAKDETHNNAVALKKILGL
ncbi:MAG TPA: DUF488 family protein [Fimbriimonadales bacterium]|nr:DUF488 family protein [Fimbriimonadales bacterium]